MGCERRGRKYMLFLSKALPLHNPRFVRDKYLFMLSLFVSLFIIISSLSVLAEGVVASNPASPKNPIAEYWFDGIAIVVRKYSSGSPEPAFVRLPVVSGRVVIHFPQSFVKFKVALICSSKTSKPVVKGNLAIVKTRCVLRLPLVLNFNASVKVYRLSNGLIKTYLYLNMTYIKFLIKRENSRIGTINGHIITYSSGTYIFPLNSVTPLRIKFPVNLLSGIKLLYIFTERPSDSGAVVKANGTYTGNILPFYVLWPSNVSEYMSYKRRHMVMVFAGTGFKLKFGSLLNQVFAYVPYGIAHIYYAVLTPLSPSGFVRNSLLFMLVPSISGVPVTRIMAVTNSTSLELRYLKVMRKALQSGEYSYYNISAKYAVFPKNNTNITNVALPIVDIAQFRNVGFYYTLHYPIAIVSLPLPLYGKAAKVLGGDAIILYGYADNHYIIPSEQKIKELSGKIVNSSSSRHTIPPYLIPALTLGTIAIALSAVYASRRRRR